MILRLILKWFLNMKNKFECAVCKRTDMSVLNPSKKGWICIHCHWDKKIPIEEVKEDLVKDEFKENPFWIIDDPLFDRD